MYNSLGMDFLYTLNDGGLDMDQNSNVGTSTRLMDDTQQRIYRIYDSAEKSGNWDQVAEFELKLLLQALDATKSAPD